MFGLAAIGIGQPNNLDNLNEMNKTNIHLLMAKADEGGLLGQRCNGGCAYGTSQDICILCSTCAIKLSNKPIGYVDECE